MPVLPDNLYEGGSVRRGSKGRKPLTLDQMLAMPLAPEYRVRFIPPEDSAKLVNLYHLARTALCREPMDRQTPYFRMLWASREYARGSNSVSETAAYKDLCGLLDR